MTAISNFFAHLIDQILHISVFDVLDILIVSVVFFYVFKFISDRRAGKLTVGILFVVVTLFVSDVLNMRTLNFIIENVLQVGIIGLLIIFQDELRSFLEKMGGSSIIGTINKKSAGDIQRIMECINNVVDSCVSFSENKTGALMVFERGTKLGDVIRTGTVINSDPSAYLIKNVFFNKAPLHDGALIIRDFRLYAAGCFLPLSQDVSIIKDLGTRHRAAIGISEISDSVVVVVSEETGVISIAVNGSLERNFDAHSLKDALTKYLIGEDEKPKKKFGKN